MDLATNITVDLVSETCPRCGIAFGVPSQWQRARREDHAIWYCPNGHQWVYRESENDSQLKAKDAEIDNLRKRLKWREDSLESTNRSLETAHRSNAALRGEIGKAKKRNANGVCPCCQRTFKQLSAHMAGKHPEYVADANATQAAKGAAKP